MEADPFEGAFQRPAHNLCLPLTGQTTSRGPPYLQGNGDMGALSLPAKAGCWVGKELALEVLATPSNESASFVPPTGAPFTEQMWVEHLRCARVPGVETPQWPHQPAPRPGALSFRGNCTQEGGCTGLACHGDVPALWLGKGGPC